MSNSSPAKKATKAPIGPANEEQKIAILNRFSGFVFDLDGTIWRGDELIPNAKEVLELLRQMGKTVYFVTNNSTKSRRMYVEKFKALKIQASMGEVYGSSYAAAAYLKRKIKNAFVIGEAGLVSELQEAGITVVGGPEFSGLKASTSEVAVDPKVGAVVVGLDREINYYKIQYGLTCLRENKDCLFIATNTDARGNLNASTQECAGAGSMVGALIGATEMDPVVVGKPSAFFMDCICSSSGLSANQICVVGDNLDTDIQWAVDNGAGSLLVLTGVTSEAMLKDAKTTTHPDAYVQTLGDLLSVKDKVVSTCVVS